MQVFSVNTAKFLSTPTLKNICERRLLEFPKIETKVSHLKKSIPMHRLPKREAHYTTLSIIAMMEIF